MNIDNNSPLAIPTGSKEYQHLDSIALKTGTDKSSDIHNYTEIYAKYFSSLRDQPIKLLEIGIYQGASVQLWEEYFKNAELHFIDITLQNVEYSSNRSKYHLADQESPDQLAKFISEAGGDFDIIIDDGGHTMTQQITSFCALFPYVKSGGMYILEDLHTSYWLKWGGGSENADLKAGSQTTVQFLKNLVDEVNFVGAKTSKSHKQDLSSLRNELTIYREQILGLHFYDSLCIILKM